MDERSNADRIILSRRTEVAWAGRVAATLMKEVAKSAGVRLVVGSLRLARRAGEEVGYNFPLAVKGVETARTVVDGFVAGAREGLVEKVEARGGIDPKNSNS